MSYDELQAKDVKPRKPHRCEWCATIIEKGERCFYRAYVWQGDFNSGYMHFDCKEAMQKSDRYVLEEGWQPGEFKRGEIAV